MAVIEIDEKAPAGQFRVLTYYSVDGFEDRLVGDFNSCEEAIEAANEATDFKGGQEWQLTAVVFNDKGGKKYSRESKLV